MTLKLQIHSNNASRFLSACIMLVIVFSCKKNIIEKVNEPIIIKPDTCISIPQISNPNTGYNYIFDSILLSNCCYNPNNSNEIILSISNSNGTGLYKLNLLTKQLIKLYDGEIWSEPSWGKNDWILFTLPDECVWKIKSNGDSLTKISDTGCFNPLWSPDAKYYLYTNPSYQNKTTIFNLNDSVIKVLPLSCSVAWNEDNILVFSESHGVYFYYFDNDSLTFKWFEFGFNGGGFVWVNNHEVIYTSLSLWPNTENYFIKLDINGNTSNLKSYCNGWQYNSRTYNPVSNKIIFSKYSYTVVNSNTLFVRSHLVISNPDGSNELKLNFL